MLTSFKKSVLAGLAIGICGILYVVAANKELGAVLFAFGLITICSFNLNLFTGKIGYLFTFEKKLEVLLIWLGNLIGCLIAGALIRFARPAAVEAANAVVAAKLNQKFYQTAILGFFCGMIMYVAVENYKSNPHGFSKYLGIIFGIPVFILAGFEHSIADMVYFSIGVKTVSEGLRGLLFVLIVTVGNGVGSLVFRWLTKPFAAKKLKPPADGEKDAG